LRIGEPELPGPVADPEFLDSDEPIPRPVQNSMTRFPPVPIRIPKNLIKYSIPLTPNHS